MAVETLVTEAAQRGFMMVMMASLLRACRSAASGGGERRREVVHAVEQLREVYRLLHDERCAGHQGWTCPRGGGSGFSPGTSSLGVVELEFGAVVVVKCERWIEMFLCSLFC